MSKLVHIPMDNLCITVGELERTLGQHVHKDKVTHTPKNRVASYTQQLQNLCTVLVHTFFGQNNRSPGLLIHRFHTANNNYYINK